LILNQYLPDTELHSALDEEGFDNLEFILKHLLEGENKITSIHADKELLGQIHHAANLDNYKNKSFRKNLYDCSSTILRKTWEKYFKQCGSSDLKKTIEFDWGDNEPTKNFVSFFNYPNYLIPDETAKLKPEETIFPGKEKFEPLKVLHSYQMPIVSRVLKLLEPANARYLIQMPTGTGKTRTAMEIVTRLFNENENCQIVWFANKSELLDQASEEFIHVWNHVGKFPVKVLRMYGDSTINTIPEKGVIIFAQYDKLNNRLKKKIEDVKPHYIVVDEAHQIIAPTYNQALRKISDLQRATRIIGLTATPGRGLDKQQNLELSKEFDEVNIVRIELNEDDKKTYENNVIRYLELEEEVLSRAIPIPIKTDVSYGLTNKELNDLQRLVKGDRNEHSKDFLKKLAADNTRNILIVDKLRELAEKGKKILYFSTELSQSVLVFAALQKLGVKAVHVDADTDKSFRRQIIKKFKDTDEINVICNFDIFATGFDVPKLDVIFIARPVNSPVLFNQMIGRGTRGPKVGGTETFTLIQIIDKIKHSRFVGYDPYEQWGFWDDSWVKQND